MNWYIAKIVYRIICGDGDHTAQFDEQLRLVQSTDKDSAFYKACQLGEKEEDTFYNNKQQLVQWKFINVSELYRLGDMIDGAEMYSRIEEKDDAESYTDIINKKARGIIHSDSHQLLQLA